VFDVTHYIRILACCVRSSRQRLFILLAPIPKQSLYPLSHSFTDIYVSNAYFDANILRYYNTFVVVPPPNVNHVVPIPVNTRNHYIYIYLNIFNCEPIITIKLYLKQFVLTGFIFYLSHPIFSGLKLFLRLELRRP
jgi:hypothetical protein